MNAIEMLHGRWIHGRRARALRDCISAALPEGTASVLDVGCGDGLVGRLVLDAQPKLHLEGIDVLVRPKTHVPVTHFDGGRIPFGDRSFDAVTLVDVLHHTEDPTVLLAEAARVARRCVIVKDHLRDRPLAGPILRFMDRVGNARHGVALTYNYWPASRWRESFRALGLTPTLWRTNLELYPPGFDAIFGGSLQCLMRLERLS